jgi:hypothetical protein
MPSATVRRAITAGALTTAFALSLSVPASGTAKANDNDIVRMQFTGYTTIDTTPGFPFSIQTGDNWITYLDLYTPKKKPAGDASSRCAAIQVDGDQLTAQCSRVLRIKGGTISLHDTITRRKEKGGIFSLHDTIKKEKAVTARTAIVGGTGLYNDAEGEGFITMKGDQVHFDLHVDD